MPAPPREVLLWFCPACGKMVTTTYALDEKKPKCTKTIHKAPVVGAYYRLHRKLDGMK